MGWGRGTLRGSRQGRPFCPDQPWLRQLPSAKGSLCSRTQPRVISSPSSWGMSVRGHFLKAAKSDASSVSINLGALARAINPVMWKSAPQQLFLCSFMLSLSGASSSHSRPLMPQLLSTPR